MQIKLSGVQREVRAELLDGVIRFEPLSRTARDGRTTISSQYVVMLIRSGAKRPTHGWKQIRHGDLVPIESVDAADPPNTVALCYREVWRDGVQQSRVVPREIGPNNDNRANHNTAVQHAVQYAESQRNIESRVSSAENSTVYYPMLASQEPRHLDALLGVLERPGGAIIVQPKLNGTRCIARLTAAPDSATRDSVELYSRRNTMYGDELNHIRDELLPLLCAMYDDAAGSIVLDGEIYTPGVSLQQIRTKDYHAEYHLYDAFYADTIVRPADLGKVSPGLFKTREAERLKNVVRNGVSVAASNAKGVASALYVDSWEAALQCDAALRDETASPITWHGTIQRAAQLDSMLPSGWSALGMASSDIVQRWYSSDVLDALCETADDARREAFGDAVDATSTVAMCDALRDYFARRYNSNAVQRCPTFLVRSKDTIDALFTVVREANEEGLMLRRVDAPYFDSHGTTGESMRSADLVKYKVVNDAEYEVVAYKDGKGRSRNAMLLGFAVPGVTGKFRADRDLRDLRYGGEIERVAFWAMPKNATVERRIALMAEIRGANGEHDDAAWRDKWHGRRMTIEYRGLTDAGIPSQPKVDFNGL